MVEDSVRAMFLLINHHWCNPMHMHRVVADQVTLTSKLCEVISVVCVDGCGRRGCLTAEGSGQTGDCVTPFFQSEPRKTQKEFVEVDSNFTLSNLRPGECLGFVLKFPN